MKSNTHPKGHEFLTQSEVMKDLTIINDFVIIDTENDNYGLKVFFVHVSDYNDGFFEQEDIKEVQVEYMYQIKEKVSGYEFPHFDEIKINPDDIYFDQKVASEIALDVAHEMIRQYEIKDLANV